MNRLEQLGLRDILQRASSLLNRYGKQIGNGQYCDQCDGVGDGVVRGHADTCQGRITLEDISLALETLELPATDSGNK
jgi:hypothetical protein